MGGGKIAVNEAVGREDHQDLSGQGGDIEEEIGHGNQSRAENRLMRTWGEYLA